MIGNSQQHIQALKVPGVLPAVGDISLKNSLDLCHDTLKYFLLFALTLPSLFSVPS